MINVKNAELLRYMRSELRLSRVATIVSGTVFGAGLLSLILSAAHEHQPVTRLQYWREVYAAIFVVSTLVLILWTLINASQAVVSERTHRTFDFWRTTRLSPMTLAIGKLIGAPIGAWLQFAVALPILVFAGVMGGYSVITTVGSMLVLAMFNLALGSLALCLSMRARDPRRSTMLTLLLAVFVIPNLTMRMSWFAGRGADSAWSAFNPFGGLAAWHEGHLLKVMLFGHAVSSLLVTVLLSVVVIGWCMAALVRSIKMEPEQRSLFSPMQVVGVSASVLLFVYAAFRPNFDTAEWTLDGLMATGVVATFLCLYFTVVSTLFSRDSLRHRVAGHERWAGGGAAVSSVDCHWSDWLVRGGVGVGGLPPIVRRRGGPVGRTDRPVPGDHSVCDPRWHVSAMDDQPASEAAGAEGRGVVGVLLRRQRRTGGDTRRAGADGANAAVADSRSRAIRRTWRMSA